MRSVSLAAGAEGGVRAKIDPAVRAAARPDRITPVATDSWINETLYPDWGQRFLVKRELARVRSDFQDIVIFDSTSHGRVMVLDGVIQITERDEFVYQELLTHGAAANVLIIGAGDGGVLRRVLQHRTVKRAVMAEIDGEVIRLAKQFM